MSTQYKRSGNKWNINELISLQREFELLEMSVKDIAVKHCRSEIAILYKLEYEGYISSWDQIPGYSDKEKLHKSL